MYGPIIAHSGRGFNPAKRLPSFAYGVYTQSVNAAGPLCRRSCGTAEALPGPRPTPPSCCAACQPPFSRCGIHSAAAIVSYNLSLYHHLFGVFVESPAAGAPRLPGPAFSGLWPGRRLLGGLFQLGKPEFEDDFFVLGQLDPLDQAHQQLAVFAHTVQKPPHQLPRPVLV